MIPVASQDASYTSFNRLFTIVENDMKAQFVYNADYGRVKMEVLYLTGDYYDSPMVYLGRGYTGHEHLTDFGLVNMNIRMYDPATSRFLSPDNYVQSELDECYE